jgi:hypothetical protein
LFSAYATTGSEPEAISWLPVEGSPASRESSARGSPPGRRQNDYAFGFSMSSPIRPPTTAITEHPIPFLVRERWIPEVECFLEIDYVPL